MDDPPATNANPLRTPPKFIRRSVLTFLAMFVITYAALYSLYLSVPDRVFESLYYYGIVLPGSAAVKVVSPDEVVVVSRNSIQSRTALLEIVHGCDGIELLLLLSAAIVAFPALWTHKAAGLLSVVALVYVVNETRIVALYFVLSYRSAWFDLLHEYLIPGTLLALCGAWFMWWASRATIDKATDRPAA